MKKLAKITNNRSLQLRKRKYKISFFNQTTSFILLNEQLETHTIDMIENFPKGNFFWKSRSNFWVKFWQKFFPKISLWKILRNFVSYEHKIYTFYQIVEVSKTCTKGDFMMKTSFTHIFIDGFSLIFKVTSKTHKKPTIFPKFFKNAII